MTARSLAECNAQFTKESVNGMWQAQRLSFTLGRDGQSGQTGCDEGNVDLFSYIGGSFYVISVEFIAFC